MQLLFLTSRLPYPPDRGDRLRTHQFLRLFAREHDVTLVSFVSDEKERLLAGNLEPYCREIHLLPLPKWKSAVSVALNAWRNLPLQTLYYRSRQMEKMVGDLLSSVSFDAAYVHLFRMAPYLANHPDIYRILDLTDLISHELQSSIPYQTVPWRFIYQIEGPRIARYEKQITSSFDEVWFISRRDRDLLSKGGQYSHLHVVPNSVDEDLFSLTQTSSVKIKLLFLGHLDVKHNIDAARYMAEKIMPLILQKAPECEFQIVGAGDKQNVMALDRLSGVRVIGYVSDLKEVFRQSTISVAPLRFSAGMQNKVIESMAAGLPVVTTSDVSAGLGTHHERELLVAENAVDFAAQVLRLIGDEELRKRLGGTGQAYARIHFSPQPTIDRLKSISGQSKDCPTHD